MSTPPVAVRFADRLRLAEIGPTVIALTVRLNPYVWDAPPPAAVSVSGNVPVVALVDAAMVSVVTQLVLVRGGGQFVGSKGAVTPFGKPASEKVTGVGVPESRLILTNMFVID